MNLDFFEHLSDLNREWFQSEIELERGYEILNENDQCQHALFLIDGEI